MTHKKYKLYTLTLLIITVTALVVTAAMLSLKRQAAAAGGRPAAKALTTAASAGESAGSEYYTPNPASSQENPETAWSDGYIVTLHRGRIGVFPAGEDQPVLTADVEAYLLPHDDLALLQKGIWAGSLSEARKILEDYD